MKTTNTHIVGSQEKKGEGRKLIWVNNGWKLPKPGEKINVQIQEVQEILTKIYPNESTSGYTIIKLSKVRQTKTFENIKSDSSCTRELSSDPSGFTHRKPAGQKALGWYIQMSKENNCQPRALCPAERSFKTQTNKSQGSLSPLDLHYKKS